MLCVGYSVSFKVNKSEITYTFLHPLDSSDSSYSDSKLHAITRRSSDSEISAYAGRESESDRVVYSGRDSSSDRFIFPDRNSASEVSLLSRGNFLSTTNDSDSSGYHDHSCLVINKGKEYTKKHLNTSSAKCDDHVWDLEMKVTKELERLESLISVNKGGIGLLRQDMVRSFLAR